MRKTVVFAADIHTSHTYRTFVCAMEGDSAGQTLERANAEVHRVTRADGAQIASSDTRVFVRACVSYVRADDKNRVGGRNAACWHGVLNHRPRTARDTIPRAIPPRLQFPSAVEPFASIAPG